MTVSRPSPLDRLHGRLIVSCQAYPGEPMRHPETMAQVAQAVLAGGAAGIRAQGLADIAAIRAVTDAPLVGLVKEGSEGVVITPTADLALAVLDAGADIVAIDATARPRPDGASFADVLALVRERRPDAVVMADVATYDEGVAAEALGADIVASTLSGYTADAPDRDGPDVALVRRLSGRLSVPVVAEGRIHTPTQARQALDAGATAVVVGTAITHPTTITSWFADALH